MSPSKSITGVRIRTVRPSSSVKMTGVMSLVGQPCQLPAFLALAGSELTGWSIRRKSGTASSSFTVATLQRARSGAGGLVVAPLGGGAGLGEVGLTETVEPGPAVEDLRGEIGGDAGVGQHPGRDVGEARIEMREVGRYTDIVRPAQQLGDRADLALAALDRREAVALPVFERRHFEIGRVGIV